VARTAPAAVLVLTAWNGADRAEDALDERGFHLVQRQAPGPELTAGGVHQGEHRRQMPCGGDVGTKGAATLTALDQRLQRSEDRAVPPAKVRSRQPGVDRHERVVAPERAPRRPDDAAQGVAGIAFVGLGRRDARGGVDDRAVRDGVDQRLARGKWT
jgi:hypothetical protein